jgi:ABC-type uncharacterized transport system permease subunit
MFEHFKFKQLDGLKAENAQILISNAKAKAYQAPSYWMKNVLAFVLAVVLGIFLMQLPKLLNIDQTIIGMLIQGSGILVGVFLYHNLAKQIFLKYLVNQINKT